MNRTQLRDYAREIRHRVDIQRLKRSRGERIKAYLAQTSIPKVQVGTGDHELAGWLNTDAWPRTGNVVYVDMTETLPFPDLSINYLYSEHAIEHVPYAMAARFIRECKRVLKPGGRLRLATPNLMNLIRLFQDDLTDEQRRYVEWSQKRNMLPPTDDARCFVLNNFVRAWGHQFIYDPTTMMSTLIGAGFSNPRLYRPGESDQPELVGLERHGATIGDEFNRFETMVVEAEA